MRPRMRGTPPETGKKPVFIRIFRKAVYINMFTSFTETTETMTLELLKGKIHRARLTACDLNYEGSLAIDPDYLDLANILPYERILVVNATNGNRLETYAIPGERGSGVFCLNGAAAHLGRVGDVVTIMCFGYYTPEEAATHAPKIVVLGEHNEVLVQRLGKKVINQ